MNAEDVLMGTDHPVVTLDLHVGQLCAVVEPAGAAQQGLVPHYSGEQHRFKGTVSRDYSVLNIVSFTTLLPSLL